MAQNNEINNINNKKEEEEEDIKDINNIVKESEEKQKITANNKKQEGDNIKEKPEDNHEKDENKYNEIKEQLLRLAAEFDNYKKRAKIELNNAKNNGKAELLKNLLQIIDEFEITLIATSESKDKNIARGIELVYSNFISELKKNGLEEIKTSGLFDPYKHEILMIKESDKEYGIILETIKKGYIFNGIMLRPASVIISKGKENKDIGQKNNETGNKHE
ncbi:MAG: nucleotide exchange factor GrpE [Candidatus Marsarchaeota archaeon]|nr:nucleotide exchange factor GrpE [Candidatus Marsarchaeota archaeon]